jgi:hypothetical protein
MPIDLAVQKSHIKTNPQKLTSMLVVDVDEDDAERAILSKVWDDELAPEPNWVLTNPETGHAHAGYWLGHPVSTSDMSSYRARSYLYDTQKKLTIALGGDENYSNGVTRSPFATGHATRFLRSDPYELKELASTLKAIKLLPTFEVNTAEGRNVNLFEAVRKRAYSMHREFKTYPEFFDAVHAVASETNVRMEFIAPLPESEVKSVARSISKWTWKRFNGGSFTERQKAVVNKRWDKVRNGDVTNEVRLLKLAATREEVIFLHQRGLTQAEVARATGLTKDQVKEKLRYARKLGEV